MTIKMLDTFAGAGGWDVGARALGITHIDRVENWAPANATAWHAGFGLPIERDVRDFHTAPGEYDIHAGSPSCRTFAISGKGEGRKVLRDIVGGIRAMGSMPSLVIGRSIDIGVDPDAALTMEPMRLILEGMPRAVALEQAPSVLPIWEAYADVMRERGYAVRTGIVDAHDFGAPQIRKRAVLLARRDRAEVAAPARNKMVSLMTMQDGIGWGMTHRAAYTITGGGTYTGGAEPWGNAARKGMRREYEAGRWAGEWRNRPTHAEAAKLQTFPDGYPFQGNGGQRYQQIGNAVPPRLAEALLRVLL